MQRLQAAACMCEPSPQGDVVARRRHRQAGVHVLPGHASLVPRPQGIVDAGIQRLMLGTFLRQLVAVWREVTWRRRAHCSGLARNLLRLLLCRPQWHRLHGLLRLQLSVRPGFRSSHSDCIKLHMQAALADATGSAGGAGGAPVQDLEGLHASEQAPPSFPHLHGRQAAQLLQSVQGQGQRMSRAAGSPLPLAIPEALIREAMRRFAKGLTGGDAPATSPYTGSAGPVSKGKRAA